MNGNVRVTTMGFRPQSCFQFVKRMNGNGIEELFSVNHDRILLPIREAYEWKLITENIPVKSPKLLLPIREAYEWKQCVGLIHELTLQFFKFQLVKCLNRNDT